MLHSNVSVILTLQPIVWEEMHVQALAKPKRSAKGVHNTSAQNCAPTYAVVELASVRGEVFIFPNHKKMG